MISKVILAAVGAIAGYALAAYGFQASTDALDTEAAPMPALDIASACVPGDSERALVVERDTTQRLLHEIDRLETEIDRLSAGQSAPDPLEGQAWFRQTWTELMAEEPAVDRRQQLVDGGFDPLRAEWLLQRESELQMAAIEQRDVEMELPLDYLQTRVAARRALRNEVGDYEYEQYLAATGQSTTVAVMRVVPDSPAAIGGLQVGDEIVEYDGERVFSVFELSDTAGAGATAGAAMTIPRRSERSSPGTAPS